MSGDERRGSARILSEFPLTLAGEDGALLDDRALAHDVSGKGFKLETQAKLAEGQLVGFRLFMGTSGEPPVSGRARVVWVQSTAFATWAGAEFRGLGWSERRRVRRFTHPSEIDWSIIVDKAFRAGMTMLLVLLIWTAMSSPLWRDWLIGMLPIGFASAALGWALVQLLRPRR